MTTAVSTDRASWVIPPGALPKWQRLTALVDEIGAVPCRTSDPEAWWLARTPAAGHRGRRTPPFVDATNVEVSTVSAEA